MEYDEIDKYKPDIIIDNGGGYIKAGLSGEEGPKSVFPTIIGYPKYSTYNGISREKKNFKVGSDAENSKGIHKLNYPIKHDKIENWDDMENVWGHIFTNELRVYPKEHNVLITDSSYLKENREKIAQIMFETFNLPGLCIFNPGVLSLFSEGIFTGVGIDLGDGVSQFVPVYDGFPITYFIKRYNFGGRE